MFYINRCYKSAILNELLTLADIFWRDYCQGFYSVVEAFVDTYLNLANIGSATDISFNKNIDKNYSNCIQSILVKHILFQVSNGGIALG